MNANVASMWKRWRITSKQIRQHLVVVILKIWIDPILEALRRIDLQDLSIRINLKPERSILKRIHRKGDERIIVTIFPSGCGRKILCLRWVNFTKKDPSNQIKFSP